MEKIEHLLRTYKWSGMGLMLVQSFAQKSKLFFFTKLKVDASIPISLMMLGVDWGSERLSILQKNVHSTGPHCPSDVSRLDGPNSHHQTTGMPLFENIKDQVHQRKETNLLVPLASIT